MAEDLSLSQYLNMNLGQSEFCTGESQIADCQEVIDLELKNIINLKGNFDVSNKVACLNVMHDVVEKMKQLKRNDTEYQDTITKLKQNVTIKQNQLESQKQQFETELTQYVTENAKLQKEIHDMRADLKQAAQEYRALKQKAEQYSQNLNLADVTRKKLQIDNDKLRDMLNKREKPEVAPTNAKQILAQVDKAVRDLYDDIYNVKLVKPNSVDEQIYSLVEAIEHVKHTYNEDMTNTTSQVNILNKKVLELEEENQKLRR